MFAVPVEQEFDSERKVINSVSQNEMLSAFQDTQIVKVHLLSMGFYDQVPPMRQHACRFHQKM
jgi:hypothetical protein